MGRRIANIVLIALLMWVIIVAIGPMVAGVIHGNASSGDSSTVKLALAGGIAGLALVAFTLRHRVWRS